MSRDKRGSGTPTKPQQMNESDTNWNKSMKNPTHDPRWPGSVFAKASKIVFIQRWLSKVILTETGRKGWGMPTGTRPGLKSSGNSSNVSLWSGAEHIFKWSATFPYFSLDSVLISRLSIFLHSAQTPPTISSYAITPLLSLTWSCFDSFHLLFKNSSSRKPPLLLHLLLTSFTPFFSNITHFTRPNFIVSILPHSFSFSSLTSFPSTPPLRLSPTGLTSRRPNKQVTVQ